MKVLIINPPWEGKGYGTRSQNRIIKQRGEVVFIMSDGSTHSFRFFLA